MARSDSVGYGKPPVATRFKKGRSGNPNGRPRGQANLLTEIKDELKERITVREGGKSRRVTKQRAILKSLIAKGLSGDVKAMTSILVLRERLSENLPDHHDDLLLGANEREILERFVPRLLKSLAK